MIVLPHMAAGVLGYSKVLRYLILITPASIILFSQLVDEAVRRLGDKETTSGYRNLIAISVLISVVFMFLEMATGIYATFASRYSLIYPILGKVY